MHHFATEMRTHVHISVAKWCIVGYGTSALWDLWSRSIVVAELGPLWFRQWFVVHSVPSHSLKQYVLMPQITSDSTASSIAWLGWQRKNKAKLHTTDPLWGEPVTGGPSNARKHGHVMASSRIPTVVLSGKKVTRLSRVKDIFFQWRLK